MPVSACFVTHQMCAALSGSPVAHCASAAWGTQGPDEVPAGHNCTGTGARAAQPAPTATATPASTPVLEPTEVGERFWAGWVGWGWTACTSIGPLVWCELVVERLRGIDETVCTPTHTHTHHTAGRWGQHWRCSSQPPPGWLTQPFTWLCSQDRCCWFGCAGGGDMGGTSHHPRSSCGQFKCVCHVLNVVLSAEFIGLYLCNEPLWRQHALYTSPGVGVLNISTGLAVQNWLL